ncbi:hypothetical protein CIW52_03630 [Mycolicibacterium sp. P9-64]|uniref:hypothetical protein n=1 Tax=Mycolicibacterium sp. P9-64 TaxID=2024612 RepID=UPI0011EBBB76|nr:hypothetical protein [Mycolicibacterium sp. P9-64]KAA0086976.1 hypothetical protein CIW52_03630 [Mycolicibacterium sp. P9-64]
MTTAAPVASRYLVEWYRPNLTSELIDGVVAGIKKAIASMSTEGSPVRLLMTVAVPTDEVLYGVFAADSPDLVRAACERAGSVPERMSLDIDARTF